MNVVDPHCRRYIVFAVHVGGVQRDVQGLCHVAEVHAVIRLGGRTHEVNFFARFDSQVGIRDFVPIIFGNEDAFIQRVSALVVQVDFGGRRHVAQDQAVIAAVESQAFRFEFHGCRIARNINSVRAVAETRMESLNRRFTVEDNI